MTHTLLLLTSLTLSAADPRPGTASFAIARDGKALAPVVISPKASERTRAVADELATYLGRITGGKFEVTTGDSSRGIVLGTLAEFPDPALNEGLKIRDTYDGKEAFTIRTDSNRLRLIGAADLGASHAAFCLLEHLGCRWFFPAKEWEVVPSNPTLTVRLDVTDRPAILSRRIWYGYGYFDRAEKRCQRDYEAWARHNRMAASRTIWTGHAWQSIILSNRKTFDAHPEYLALVKGKRTGPQLCVSNPAVRKLAAAWALEQFRRRPEIDMVSMETSDGSNHCECEACRHLGNISERAFGLTNEVARIVARERPGKMVGMLAYNDHCEPPSFKLEPNVYVQSTAGFVRGRYTFDELMELWPKTCKNVGFYEYFSVWLWDFDMPPGGNGANVKHITERFRKYAALGASSIDCESGNNWCLHGRGYIVANRLMWDPKTDVNALLAGFYEKAFGPAARVMRRYYERLDPGNEPLLSAHLLALALRDLEEASRLARDRPDVLARLDHLKQYQHYVRLRWEHDRTREKDRKKELTLDALTWCYRTRYSYMDHWAGMLYSWTRKAAQQFDEPTWAFDHKGSPQPWKVEKLVSHDETEQTFRKDLAYFRPEPVEEVTFSPDLVPAGLQTKSPAISKQRFQRGARYALFSIGGEPLRFSITTGIIAWYRDRADAVWAITDAAGKQTARGRLPQDGKDHSFEVKVPRSGLYWLEFNDQGAAWGLTVEAGNPAVLALKRSRGPNHLGQMQRMYFYVPRGLKEIVYFWDGRPHEVWGPDGKLAAKVTESGKFIRVPVPEGASGKAWSLNRLALGRLWFFNVPNYLAASPDALLIPREVARADGLAPEKRFVATPLTKDKEFTAGIEGPACDAAGNIYAVNYARQGTIGRVTPEGKGEVFVSLPGKSVGNGIVFDKKGMMFVADYIGHNVLRIDPGTKKIKVFAHEDRMNQPNDLAIAPNGTLYASDPNWGKNTGQVWRIDTSGKVTLVAPSMGTTNGIEVSPDGKTLYVNESVQRNVWAFTIKPDGSLADKRLLKKFEDHGFDGMRCDVDGNLYIARYGKGTVVVVSPQGKILHEVDILGAAPSNLCFGGPDGRTVYVTEVKKQRLVQFRTDRPGLAWQRLHHP
jgi:gluconolactonase